MSCLIINVYLTLIQKALKVNIYMYIHLYLKDECHGQELLLKLKLIHKGFCVIICSIINFFLN